MSGSRNTGTVPKTKLNARPRRDNNPVNLVPNNLDWHPEYPPQRARKESNNYASHLSDTGDDFLFEGPGSAWQPLAPTNRTDDDELRWVKSSNITPERGNMDGHVGNRVMLTAHRQDNNNGEEAAANKEPLARGRLKLKMEQSKRKIEELQQQQAALINLRNKAIQQVKPVQMEEMQNHPQHPHVLRNKAVQQVKPVQVEMEKMANLGERLQTMQDYAHIIQAFEREDAASSNLEGPETQNPDQLRNKLSELLSKKAQCDNILSCLDPDNIDVAGSQSSEEGDSVQYGSRYAGAVGGSGGDADSQGDTSRRRDLQEIHVGSSHGKQNNREIVDHVQAIQNKELKLEEVKYKLEQLQSLLNRVERLRESGSVVRMNGDAQANARPGQQAQGKNCPSSSMMEKLHTKKIDLEQDMRKAKSYPQQSRNEALGGYDQLDNWSAINGAATNSVEYSSVSDDADVEYDESPVKLCATTLFPPAGFPKTRQNIHHNIANGPHLGKAMSGVGRSEVHRSAPPSVEPRPRRTQSDDGLPSPNSTTLALQINQLQMQMEQLLLMYQSLMEKQVTNFTPPPQPWLTPQPSLGGYMPYMSGGPQWHQHQLLVNSLNQCCQLIWHQQRELAGLRQALAMLQEESNMFKCGGYGNNLNFDPGLLWPQTSPQTLNNQVPPGNRANNYWDNFRSYSRQNLLSGRNKSNEGSIAESMPTARPPTSQTDNLRRKDNSATNAQRQPAHHFDNASRLRRRFTPKHDMSAMFSLEQSIYSELDTVIAEAERSPQMLLQLLSQLKNLRAHHPSPFEESQAQGFDGELDMLERSGVLDFLPRADELRQPSNDHDYDVSKVDLTMAQVSRLIERQQDVAGDVTCSPEFLQQVVTLAMRITHHMHPDVPARLEASLLKFQGSRLSQVADELLCVVASLLTPQPPPPNEHRVQPNQQQNEDNEEEEGAVGGIPLGAHSSQQDENQSIETELAEADQTQHGSSDNVVIFEVQEALDGHDIIEPLAPSPTREDRADHHQ